MVQAAARGIIDFETLDLREPRAHTRMTIMLRALVAENQRAKYWADAQYYLSAMQVNLAPDDYGQLRDLAVDTVRRYTDSFQPWAAKQRLRDDIKTVKSLTSAWEDAFGRLDDPRTRQGIAETVEALKTMRVERVAKRRRLAAAREKMLAREQERRELRRHEQRKRQ